MNPCLLTDMYKIGHFNQYPKNTTLVYSNFTPRKSRVDNVNEIVFFGLQYFIKSVLIDKFNKDFFELPLEDVIKSFKRTIDNTLGKDSITTTHIEALHKLGYLPVKIKALPEGTICPIGVPCLTIVNTLPEFYWLTNFLETVLSCELWLACTSATTSKEYRNILDKYALLTTGNTDFVQWQAHDFSMRGMSSLESACISGAAHLLSFTGSDTLPALNFLETYYNADSDKELVMASVAATEHAVQCAGGMENERETYRRLLEDVYPNGIVSIVSDTWDLWNVLDSILPSLKESIMKRDGKCVIRPDSSPTTPYEIICGFDIIEYKNDKYIQSLEDAKEYARQDLVDKIREETPHGEYGEANPECIFKYENKYYKLKVNIEWNRHDKQFYYIDGNNIQSCTEHFPTSEELGVVEVLYNTFGGTVNELGYKVLDSHIGMIYGEAISHKLADKICNRLMEKGFVSTSCLFGVGSYSFTYCTRDTYGFAMKATYCEIDGKCHPIFKDPKTDGTKSKKSLKGLLAVQKVGSRLHVFDNVIWEEEKRGELKTVFEDGKLLVDWSLAEIRERVRNNE